jgi:hypothetical protein
MKRLTKLGLWRGSVHRWHRDRTRLGTAGLCALAFVAVSAMLTTSAFAINGESAKWRTCVPSPKIDSHGTGFYTDSACSMESASHEGGYEEAPWATGETTALKGKGAKSTFYIYAFNQGETGSDGVVWKVECAKDKSDGELTGPHAGWIQVTFEKCTGIHESEGTTVQCKSAAGKGKIATAKLVTELESFDSNQEEDDYFGYAELVIGKNYPQPVVTFECGSTEFELTGGLGAPEVLEPVLNRSCSKTLTLGFKVDQAAGEEGVPLPFEGAPGGYGGGSGHPTTVIEGTLFGTGLEATETVKMKSKSTVCVDNKEPNT